MMDFHNKIMPPNIFQCDHCKLIFKLKDDLVQHITKDHKSRQLCVNENLICDYCKTVFIQKEALIQHITSKHNELKPLKIDRAVSDYYNVRTNKFTCDTCGLNFKTVEVLRKHIKTDHTFEDFRKFCKKSLQREEKLVKKLFNCGFCKTRFFTYDDMEKHARRYHDVKPNEFACDVCCKTFLSNDSLCYHKKVCSKTAGPHSCMHCSKMFTEVSSLEFHVRIFHPRTNTGDSKVSSTKDETPSIASAVYDCDHCEKSYYSDRSLKHHIRLKHTIDEEVVCNLCSKVCSNKFYLKIHMKITHTEKSLLKCEICSKIFSTTRNLRRHTEYTHKKVNRYKCMDCISLFKEKRSLRKHIRRKHPNSSVYPCCNICSKRFESAKACKLHLRLVHSIIINTHPCHLCAESLTSYSALKNHVQTKHFLDSQIFRCEKCNLTFYGGEGFDKHSKECKVTSSKKSPHLCVICVKYFSSRKSLFRHLKLFHKSFNHIALAIYGSKGKRVPNGCDTCIKLMNSELFNNKFNYNMRKGDDLQNVIVFTCKMCGTGYNPLEIGILKYRCEEEIKFSISQFCTAEISENNSQKYVEPESTTSDFETCIKTEMNDDDNSLPSVSNIKKENDVYDADVKPKIEFEEVSAVPETVVKSEPMSP